MYAWGWNARNQLGLPGGDRERPVHVVGLGAVTSIAAGQAHAVAVAEGALVGWGSNAAGQLGGSEFAHARPHALMMASTGGRHGA